MFSKRTGIELRKNRWAESLEAKSAGKKRLIDLTLSNPTRCGFRYPSGWFRALAGRENLIYRPDPRGSLDARRAIARYYREQGAALAPERLFITSGSSESYHHLFTLLTERGDRLLVPLPGYPLIESLAKLHDLSIRPFRQVYDGRRWKIDFESLKRAMRTRAGALLIVHPNNPTGFYLDREEQRRVIELARKAVLPVIADEVFFDFRMTAKGDAPSTFASQKHVLTFTLNGLSKTAALPQMKLSWIAVTGPEKEVQTGIERLAHLTDTYLTANTPSQNALSGILKQRRRVQSQLRARVWENRAFLQTILSRFFPAGELLRSEGGWYGILRLPAVLTDEEWAIRFLEREGVVVYPGHFFDLPIEACLVISLIPPPPLFRKGIRRIIRQALRTVSPEP